MSVSLVIPPHPALAPWVHHILVMGLDVCTSQLPSALSPCLTVFARGGSRLEHADGSLQPVPRASLTGPYLHARRSRVAPGTVFLALMFRPGCMDEALGPAVAEVRERIVPLEDIAPAGAVGELLERIDASADPHAWATATQAVLLRMLRPTRDPARCAALLGERANLFQPARLIADRLGIGERQLERRIARAYGANLRELRRIARFGFTLAAMTARPPARGELTRIALDFGYYDQAHMDRDFRALAGLAPGALLRAIAGDDPGYWLYRFRHRQFRDLFLPDDVDSVQARLFAPA
ncbi:AraC family transcriptional regulator [Azoarcus olearius]|uniref:AraC-family transcriptional regulator n=1 Tax=Azoarcus sp. (strain BH72) TaxID=418699 RepID=A1K3P2_AZOSB|nr:helix-turn-helix domain-containing protein [Azoarcus olearius]CAL93447.1 putative AraC-family transcriptional regulator [Azoarcus olearius]